jgi:two-component system response regulator PilR (NtrC family)
MEHKAKILILDDEPIVGERLKASLERDGYIVDIFVSSPEAIISLENNTYDVLITDIKMSAPDGMEVVRIAKQANPDIKPVIITGFATKETAEEAKKMGAVDFIAKPFKISELKNLIRMLARKIDN